MVLIEHLHTNGSRKERIAHQHVIDRARQSDRKLKDEAKQARLRWWKDLTGISATELLDTEHAMQPGQAISLTHINIREEQPEENVLPDFLSTFKNTDSYRVIKTQLYDYLDSSDTPESHHKILQEFAGAAFERLAYQYFANDFGEYAAVLTPEQTDTYFMDHYEERDIKQFPFGKIGLSGVVVPDSLVVVGDDILYQAEFSLHRKMDYYHHKYEGFLRNKYARTFNGAYDTTQLIFGVPHSFPLEMQEELQDTYGEDIDIYRVPFTHKEFYNEVLHPLSHLWGSEK